MANCVQCGRKLPPMTFGRKICQWCVQHERAQRGEPDGDVRQQVIPAPWVRQGESTITLTHVLFGANVAVFIAMVLASGSTDFSGRVMLHFGANFGPLTLSGDWWRLLTYMFVHGDFWHIAFNMWCLWDLGRMCESLYGRWTYAAVYLISGIAAGVASVAWNPGVLSVGASGAIFGLAGALIASFYLGEFNIPSFAIQANLKGLLFFAGFNILFGISFIGDLFGIHVDNACHIGGLISGLILGALIARLAPQHDAPMRRVGVLAVVALAVVGAALGVARWRGAPFRAARAFESLSENAPDRGTAQLEAIVQRQPKLAEAHLALGQAYFNEEKYPQSETEFKRVLELQPRQAMARFDLGLVYLNEKRPEDAKAAFSQILSQDANDADAHYGLGLVLEDEAQYQAAVEEFKTTVKLGPQASGVYVDMGNAYAKLQKYDDAIAAYNKGKETDGDNPDLETALADAYQAKGLTQQAQDARAKAEKLKHGGQQ